MASSSKIKAAKPVKNALNKPTYVLVRKLDGDFFMLASDESVDPAFKFHEELKRKKLVVREQHGFTDAWLSIRGRGLSKHLKFP